jgi:hypothetical protein
MVVWLEHFGTPIMALPVPYPPPQTLLAGYGRLKLFRTLFRMFRTFCVSDASFGLFCFGNYFFKDRKPNPLINSM